MEWHFPSMNTQHLCGKRLDDQGLNANAKYPSDKKTCIIQPKIPPNESIHIEPLTYEQQ